MRWEYLFLRISGRKKGKDEERALWVAEDMLVTTSDGRWNNTRMPLDTRPGGHNEPTGRGRLGDGQLRWIRRAWFLASQVDLRAVRCSFQAVGP